MPIDPNIALGYRGVEVPNPLAGMAQVAQIQNALQQQRMGGIQMQNALREQARQQELETIMSQLSPTAPVNEQAAALQKRGFFPQAQALVQQAATLSKTQREAEDARLKALTGKAEMMGRFFSSVTDQPTYDAARQSAIAAGLGTADEIPTTYDPSVVQRILNNSMSLKDQIAARQREREVGARETSAGAAASQAATASARLPLEERRTAATELQAQTGSQNLGVQQQRLSLEGQRLEQQQRRFVNEERRLSNDERRLQLAEETARLAQDPAHQQALAQGRAAGQAIAKSEQSALEILPKVISSATEAIDNIDAMIGKPAVKDPQTGKVIKPAVPPHPGFETAVGATMLPGARFVPGTNAADFQARFDQLKGSAFLQAYETLRGAGQITNIEGEKGTAAINRMSLAQSEQEFVAAAREFQAIVRKGLERAQARAQEAQSSRAANVAPRAPVTAPNVIDFGSLK